MSKFFRGTDSSSSSSSVGSGAQSGSGVVSGAGSGNASGGGSASGSDGLGLDSIGLGFDNIGLGLDDIGGSGHISKAPRAPEVPVDDKKIIRIEDRQYTLGRQKPSGSYGLIYQAYEAKNKDKKLIIKVIHLKETDFGMTTDILREASILKHLDHGNIIKLVDVIGEPDRVVLVFDFFDWTLGDYMTACEDDEKFKTVKKLLHQILCALEYCHAAGVLHRDLNLSNILVDKTTDRNNHAIKLIDFGLSRVVAATEEIHSADMGTLAYTAPEMLVGKLSYSYPCDVWSLGITFAKMTGIDVFPDAKDPKKQLELIFSIVGRPNKENWPKFSALDLNLKYLENSPSQDLSVIYKDLGEDGVDLLKGMLCLNPEHRITLDDALRHRYFQ